MKKLIKQIKFNWIEWDKPDFQLEQINSDTGRLYKSPNGKFYPSVTTVLSIEESKELKEWQEAVGEKEASIISKRATTKGTILHNLAEQYLSNQEVIINNPFLEQNFNNLKLFLINM